MKISVITDTDSSLPLEMAAEYGIRQVPPRVHFGDDTFEAVYEINDAQLFERIEREGRLATTSAGSPNDFVKAYQEAFAEGADALIVYTVSSKMSSFYQSASLAAESFPGKSITVVDSQTLCLGQGNMAIAAAKAARAGASLEEALAAAQSVAGRQYQYGNLSTLRYMAQSGRVGKLTAGMANALDLKPVLTVKDGSLQMIEKVRTRRRAWARVIELTEEAVGGRAIEFAAVVHTNIAEDAARFKAEAEKRLPLPADTPILEFNPGLSVHTGPGVVSIYVLTSE